MKVTMPYSDDGKVRRVFDLAPIKEGVMNLEQAINVIRRGEPVGWTMEPGDATRYRLILIPLWTRPDLRLAGGDGGVGRGERWLLVVKPGDGSACVPAFCTHYDLTGVRDGPRSFTTNPWTARMVAALVRGIWVLIDEPEIDPFTFTFTEEGA